MPATTYKANKQTGVALVVVLWLLMLLGVIAGSFAKSMHVETSLAQNAVATARANAAAEAAINNAIVEILRPPGLDIKNHKKRFDGRLYQWRFAGAKVWYRIQDESGRVDLNEAQPEILMKVMAAAGVPEAKRSSLASAIVDWRDEDNTQNLNGAEDSDYAAAGKKYGAKDGPFNTVEELQRVLGMTPAIYRKLEPLLTVYSHTPQVNAMTAPKALRRALGINMTANQTGSTVDGASAPPAPGADDEDEDFADGTNGGLSGGGNLIYTLQAQAEVDNVKGATVTATVRLQQMNDQLFSVLNWREGGIDLVNEGSRRAGKRENGLR